MIHPDECRMVRPEEALEGRATPIESPPVHHVLGRPVDAEPPPGHDVAVFGMGCFWGAERLFWKMPGVYTTAVGYAGGYTPNPTYREVCTGRTGHAEVVRIVFDPQVLPYEKLLAAFWENHDPTQGMRQGNDVGTQYRSIVLTTRDEQAQAARTSLAAYQARLDAAGYGRITTTIEPLHAFYYAEAYHQQYLSKNPDGYCGLGGTGVACPVGLVPAS
ncbi:MAG: peptide-methionine (S)-S-oxide reductase MsrA [Deltaproteobacteria bacterium]|nr:MAG: peptide-methionine (S)-S-oxide reductase MsrA [Deltaproteobacteria bacterium]